MARSIFFSLLLLGLIYKGGEQATSSSQQTQRVIYGEDNRQEVYEFDNPLFRTLATSTAAMIKRERMPYNVEEGTHILNYRSLDVLQYCPTERFFEQPSVASCSGFLVAPDLLVTAGHCISDMLDCEDHYWIFNYELKSNGSLDSEVRAEDVYKCVEVVEACGHNGDCFMMENDYALVRLDREAEAAPLNFRRKGKTEEGNELVVIGHPLGLPKKIAGGAVVRKSTSPYYFVANLDTYQGNSGSAVFDAHTAEVEGVLVRGETDYQWDFNQGCFTSKVCEEDGCIGEDVTRITNIKFLSKLSDH